MVVNFLPNLIVIVVSRSFLTSIWRANKLIFQALRTGRIASPSFYIDWLGQLGVFGGAVNLSGHNYHHFSYLPGCTPPAVQGLGLLVGKNC